MISIPSNIFAYTARTKSFVADVSDCGNEFKHKESFKMISNRTGKEAVFNYLKFVANEGEVIGWEYISNPPDNPNKETYKCIIIND